MIDSSSLAKYVNREEGWEQVATRLREGCVTLELAIKEAANSLWKRAVKGELTAEQVGEVLRGLLAYRPFRLAQQEELYPDALAIAVEARITVYDALFIALARREALPLVTSDARQAEVAERLGVPVHVIP